MFAVAKAQTVLLTILFNRSKQFMNLLVLSEWLLCELSATCWCVTDTLANHAQAPGETFLSCAPGDSSDLAINDQGDTGNRHAKNPDGNRRSRTSCAFLERNNTLLVDLPKEKKKRTDKNKLFSLSIFTCQ